MTAKEIRHYARVALCGELHDKRVLRDIAIREGMELTKKFLTADIKEIHQKIDELDNMDRLEEKGEVQ